MVFKLEKHVIKEPYMKWNIYIPKTIILNKDEETEYDEQFKSDWSEEDIDKMRSFSRNILSDNPNYQGFERSFVDENHMVLTYLFTDMQSAIACFNKMKSPPVIENKSFLPVNWILKFPNGKQMYFK